MCGQQKKGIEQYQIEGEKGEQDNACRFPVGQRSGRKASKKCSKLHRLLLS
jgi:hypothetical protein